MTTTVGAQSIARVRVKTLYIVGGIFLPTLSKTFQIWVRIGESCLQPIPRAACENARKHIFFKQKSFFYIPKGEAFMYLI
jgi:hypothetical protein